FHVRLIVMDRRSLWFNYRYCSDDQKKAPPGRSLPPHRWERMDSSKYVRIIVMDGGAEGRMSGQSWGTDEEREEGTGYRDGRRGRGKYVRAIVVDGSSLGRKYVRLIGSEQAERTMSGSSL